MSRVNPSYDELREMLRSIPEGPVAMLNLMRMKPGRDPEKFIVELAALNAPIVKRVQAEIVYSGNAGSDLISEETWDLVSLVKYPNFAAFVELATDPEWARTAGTLREESLEAAKLVLTYPVVAA